MIYIFAPAGIGYLIGAVGGPRLIFRYGERRLMVYSIILMIGGSFLLGGIDTVAPFFAWFSPLRLLEPLFGVQLSDLVLAAGMIALPANLGSTAASEAVQVYVNRHVPVVEQGGIFGLEQVQQNALDLATVFILGIVATITGPQYIFFVAPVLVGAIVMMLVRYSFRHSGEVRLELGGAARFMAEERPEDKVVIDNEETGS